MNTILAHITKNKNDEWITHKLEDHLRKVGKLASSMATSFASQDWAFLAGIWHDLGKYRPAFQEYIAGKSGYNPEAHIENGKVDHSTAGAIHTIEQFPHGRILAYLVARYHEKMPIAAMG